MIYNGAIFVLLIHVILKQGYHNSIAYTQISTDGNENVDGGGPKLYKAVNFDLIFPKSFNSSENVISTTPKTIPSPTETATSVVGQPYYPLPQSNQPTYNTAATAGEKQQEPTLFVTPAPTQEPPPLAATSNEAGGTYDTQQQNTKSNKYDAQVVTHNAINMQQQQQRQQQLNDNNKAEKEQQQNYATGRAVDYHTGYPFSQVITPLIKNAQRPVYRKPVATRPSPSSSSSSFSTAKLAATSNVGKIIYPQAMYQQKPASQAEIDKLRGKGKFIDRFSPSEGVASHTFKSNDHHNHASSYKPVGRAPSATNVVNSYVAPSNLYAFPPNNINYPAQSQQTKLPLPSGTANSYSWPASGSLKDSEVNLNSAGSDNNPYQYNGPVSTSYLPPANEGDNAGSMDGGENNDGGGDGDVNNGADDDSVGVLPASAMNQENDNNNANMAGGMLADSMAASLDTQDDKTHDDNSYDTEKEYPTPPPGWLKDHPQSAKDHPHHDHHPRKPDIEFDHDHDFPHQTDIIFDNDHDHEHDHYHHSFPSYPSYPIYHQYPDIIYDDHHHDHSHIEHLPPPTTTTEAPPPEPPPEPRVKKYSYFYIGRKLWYIPLYFTVWFSFYVLWLILKSIARHKVNLPNHYVSRRSVDSYDLSQRQQEIVNQLTVSILDKIDKFKRKYKI